MLTKFAVISFVTMSALMGYCATEAGKDTQSEGEMGLTELWAALLLRLLAFKGEETVFISCKR